MEKRDLFPDLLMVSEALPFGGHLLSKSQRTTGTWDFSHSEGQSTTSAGTILQHLATIYAYANLCDTL